MSTRRAPRRDMSSPRVVPALAQRERSPLRDYAFIADGRRGALIGPSGDVAWMCFPAWSDEAVFAGLLDSGGVYRVAPAECFVTGGYYEPRSLIWRSRFVTHNGIFESRDALVYPGSGERAILLRRVFAVDGAGEMIVEFAPANDYGRRAVSGWRHQGNTFIARDEGLSVRFHAPSDAKVTRHSSREKGLEFHLKVVPGEHHDFVAEFVCGLPPREPPDPDECWRLTEAAWRAAVPDCAHVIAGTDVARSLAVLRGMTDSDGATVAAATTSLPERNDADRNYDYRFCWIRDICYVGQAGAAIAGAEAVLDDAVRFVGGRLRAEKDHTAPAYLGNGDPIYPPAKLDLPGYPGGNDVVVGNRVREQFQLDLFGESLLLFARAASCDRLDAEGWRAASIALDAIERRWDDPEAGIWELEPKRWTHSRLVCVAGLRAISQAGAPKEWGARALTLADHLLDRTNATSLHPTGRWQRAPDDERPDASLLLAEIRGALSSSDPRSEATRSSISSELSKDHYLYRYRNPSHELGEDEGALLICNFWMALATLGSGAHIEAARWFERGRSAMSTTGLFSEEFDVGEHQLRGNLPQAFIHAMFIEAAAAQGRC
jgi:alpha,alpha-trehalase